MPVPPLREHVQQPVTGNGTTTASVPTPRSYSEWARILHGTTQMEALERIAGLNGGKVVITEARDILRLVGQTRGKPKNVASHIYNMLNNSPKFEKDRPGVWRLVPKLDPIEEPSQKPPEPLHGGDAA